MYQKHPLRLKIHVESFFESHFRHKFKALIKNSSGNKHENILNEKTKSKTRKDISLTKDRSNAISKAIPAD